MVGVLEGSGVKVFVGVRVIVGVWVGCGVEEGVTVAVSEGRGVAVVVALGTVVGVSSIGAGEAQPASRAKTNAAAQAARKVRKAGRFKRWCFFLDLCFYAACWYI
jgi:hypothetical protein